MRPKALGLGGGLGGIEVAHEHRRDVVGSVVGRKEGVGLLAGDLGDVTGPADDLPVVGVRGPGHGIEGLAHDASGPTLQRLAALFEDHVPLAVELPEHGIGQAVGLQPHPQLQLVGGQAGDVEGAVLAGAGVEAGAAGLGVDLVHLVLDDEAPLLLHQAVKGLDQLLEPGRPGLGIHHVGDLAPALPLAQDGHLLPDADLDLVLQVVQLPVPLRVPGADGARALEHHVLEQVRDTGHAGGLVGAAHAGHPAQGDGGLVVAFHHHQPHAVREGLLDDGNCLGHQGCCSEKGCQPGAAGGAGAHGSSTGAG